MQVHGESSRRQEILLVVPPFRAALRPALGVSQLKANLVEEGFPAEILYLNLRFVELLGVHFYEILGQDVRSSFGDFIFSCLLFDRSPEDIERYVREIMREGEGGETWDRLFRFIPDGRMVEVIQGIAQDALTCSTQAVAEIVARKPGLVGVTSSCQENLASLFFIREIKKADPGILTILGGANCLGEMGEELFARFPELDFVGQGECDHSLVELARSLSNGGLERPIPGILSREHDGQCPPPEALGSEDLERLPFADFGDYFVQLSRLPFRDQLVPGLLIETSRGCWWGAKRLCRFCGFYGSDQVVFRTKSASRSLGEIETLVRRFDTPNVELADNIIAKERFKDLIPKLATQPVANLYCETTGSLSKEQVRSLESAGVRQINPGMESLSDRSLKLMRKPTSKLHNIQTLKWCTEAGIQVFWNHLFGIPGESVEEVRDLAQDMEALHHLDPPLKSFMRLHRFSPFFEESERWGLEPKEPAKVYRHLYPFPEASLGRLAYRFDTDFSRKRAISGENAELGSAIRRWQVEHPRSHLVMVRGRKGLVVIDTRRCAERRYHRLTGLEPRVFEYCDRAHSWRDIVENFQTEATGDEIDAVLQALVAARLMLRSGDRYLSLATEYRETYKRRVPFVVGYPKRVRVRQLLELRRRLQASPFKIATHMLRQAPGRARSLWAALHSGLLSMTLRIGTGAASARGNSPPAR